MALEAKPAIFLAAGPAARRSSGPRIQRLGFLPPDQSGPRMEMKTHGNVRVEADEARRDTSNSLDQAPSTEAWPAQLASVC